MPGRTGKYLFKRTNSQNWYLRLQYPAITAEIQGRVINYRLPQRVVSLGTPDRTLAEAIAAPEIAEHKLTIAVLKFFVPDEARKQIITGESDLTKDERTSFRVQKLLSDDDAESDYALLTIMIGVYSTADDAFTAFKEYRKRLIRRIGNLRSKPRRRQQWGAFHCAGSMEMDYVAAGDFENLGSKKQEQYKHLGYDPVSGTDLWIPHVHAFVRRREVGNDDIVNTFGKGDAVVHLKDVGSEPLHMTSGNILAYSAKIDFTTTLHGWKPDLWSDDARADYMLACMRNTRGRQGFRFWIGPSRT